MSENIVYTMVYKLNLIIKIPQDWIYDFQMLSPLARLTLDWILDHSDPPFHFTRPLAPPFHFTRPLREVRRLDHVHGRSELWCIVTNAGISSLEKDARKNSRLKSFGCGILTEYCWCFATIHSRSLFFIASAHLSTHFTIVHLYYLCSTIWNFLQKAAPLSVACFFDINLVEHLTIYFGVLRLLSKERTLTTSAK